MKIIFPTLGILLLCMTACQPSNKQLYHEQIAAAHQQISTAFRHMEQHFELFEAKKIELPQLKREVMVFNTKADAVRMQIKAMEGDEQLKLKSAALKYINGLKTVVNKEYKNLAGIVTMSDVPLNRAEDETVASAIAKSTAALEATFLKHLQAHMDHK
jgi:hypothetical protein